MDQIIQICEGLKMRQSQALGHSGNVSAPDWRPLSVRHHFLALGLAAVLAIGFNGCKGNHTDNAVFAGTKKPIKGHSKTESSAGHFLAARQALYFNDIGESANFFLKTLRDDNDNADLLRQTFMTQYHQGNITKAAALGRQMEQLNISSAFSAEPATAIAIRDRDWQAVMVLTDTISEHSPSRQFAALIKAWALVATGQGDAGITHLMGIRADGEKNAALADIHVGLHSALMAEHLGLHEEATRQSLQLVDTPMSPFVALHLAALLARNGEEQTAEKLIGLRLNANFNRTAIAALLSMESKNEPPSLLTNLVHGMIDFALLAQNQSEQNTLPARLQLARFLDPNSDVAHLLLAQRQVKTANYSDATANLSAIASDGPLGQPAMIVMSDIANENQRFTEAASILQQAIAINPEDGYLYKLLGDTYRRNSEYKKSWEAYETAYKKGHSTSNLHRNLGVTLERLSQTQAAEKHLKIALEMNPDDAFALNYLGYWWADQGRNLGEAIALIERAVELRPDSGYFVDSLGWVHFRLGKAKTAVQFLEQATVLEPADSEITGHLGDVYWYLGRRSEAKFKWRLAISLSETQSEKDKFRERLKNGLPSSEFDGISK